MARRGGLSSLPVMTLLFLLATGTAFPQETGEQSSGQAGGQQASGDQAEPPGSSSEESSEQEQIRKQAQEESVFEKLARDTHLRRPGRAPGAGWIPVPGTRTELRFGGFVQVNVIHDFQDAGFSFGEFIPSQIAVPTDNTPNTEFDVGTTRGTFETRTNTDEYGSVSAMISMDFAGQETIQPRLRQAYVMWAGPRSNVAFTVGQAWATFVDLGVWPELFDLEGPNAFAGALRQGLLRGSYRFGEKKHLVFDLALEQPDTHVENGTGLKDLPDLAARLNWQQDWGHLQAAAVGRQLVAESTTGTGRDSAFGWGLSLSGSWLVPGTKRKHAVSDDSHRDRARFLWGGLGASQDKIQLQIQGGSGIGRYVQDLGKAPTRQDAVYDDATAEITPLDESGGFVAYHHWWTDELRSQFVYGVVKVDNLTIQPSIALEKTTYAVASLLYQPFRQMIVGLEYYRGERDQRDGQTGHANRLLLGLNFGF